MKVKEKNVIRFFVDFYRNIQIPWWLYLLSSLCGIAYTEVGLQVAELLIRVNKGELYNSVIIGYVLLTVFNSLIAFAQNILQTYGGQRIVFRARRLLWKRLIHFRAEKVEEEQPSTLVSAMTAEAEEAASIISVLFLAVSSVYGFVRACITLYQFQAKLTMYMLMLIPIALFVFFIVGKTQYQVMRKRYQAINRMISFFSEHVSAGKYVKAHAMEEKELESGYRAIDTRYRADIFYAFMGALQTFLNSIYTNLTTVVIALGGSGMIRNGEMESDGINTFSTYMQKVNQYLAENLTHYQNIMGNKGALSHMNRLLGLPCEEPGEGTAWADSEEKDIVFDHVSFSYGNGAEVLRNLSFRIPAGKTTAIIGDNGCGKSTVMKLMQGLYTVTEGAVYVGANRVGEVSMEALRGRFGYVLQDNPLFDGTIRENIVYGVDKDYSEETFLAAARTACVEDYVRELADGYETQIGEGGGQLSGGQRQRIAIARTLMRKPEYLIFDEAGASIDYKTYQKIYDSVQKQRAGKTMLFIAHDMREVCKADYVLVMEHGRLEAFGTQEELKQTSATYQDYLKRLEMITA